MRFDSGYDTEQSSREGMTEMREHVFSPKQKGDVFIGFWCAGGAPADMREIASILECINQCLLDKVVYAVVGEGGSCLLSETRTLHLAMAKSIASMLEPFVDVFDPFDGTPMSGEDAAFRLFELNPKMEFTLFYLSRDTELSERVNTIERLARNIETRSRGFDPERHRVCAVFASQGGQQMELRGAAKRAAQKDLFAAVYIKAPLLGLYR
jgi:hypothetical protein